MTAVEALVIAGAGMMAPQGDMWATWAGVSAPVSSWHSSTTGGATKI